MGACNYYENRKNRKTVREVRKIPAVYCMKSCKECASLKKQTTVRCLCDDQKQKKRGKKEKACRVYKTIPTNCIITACTVDSCTQWVPIFCVCVHFVCDSQFCTTVLASDWRLHEFSFVCGL